MMKKKETLVVDEKYQVFPDPAEFFAYSASRGEYLGIAKLSKSEILTQHSINSAWQHINNFINLDHKTYLENIEMHYDTYMATGILTPFIQKLRKELLYLMQSKLTYEFINNNFKFNDLMCAIWSPNIYKYQINPGGNRLSVYSLFGPDEIEMLVFNTHRKKINWITKFQTLDEFNNYFSDISSDIQICIDFLLNWGEITPRVRFGITRDHVSYLIKDYYKIVDFYNSTIFKSNFDMIHCGFRRPVVKVPHRKVTINIKKIDAVHIARVMLLLPYFESYHGHGVEIDTTWL